MLFSLTPVDAESIAVFTKSQHFLTSLPFQIRLATLSHRDVSILTAMPAGKVNLFTFLQQGHFSHTNSEIHTA